MKKIINVAAILILCYTASAQIEATQTPAYIKNPALPAFTLYKAPDSTVFTNKNLSPKKPTLIIVFSPECSHCQHETTVLTENISRFKNVQILMTTWLPYAEMIKFYKNYKIADYPQITMAWDNKFFFLPYYKVQTFPTFILYDKNGKYIKSFPGEAKMDDLEQAFK